MRDTALESNAPFIVLTETHLKPEILDAEVKIEGYSLYRADRGPDRTHGGVAVYLRNNLIGQLVVSHSDSMCETLAIKVKSLNMLLICLYPPNSTIDNFRESLNVCQKAIDDVTDADNKVKDILQFGDFNLPCISWPSVQVYEKSVSQKSQEKQQAKILVNYVETNFLENYIYTATRGQNILDLVFSNNHQLVSNYSTTVNNKFSDHHLLTVNLNFTYNQENLSSRIYEYNVKNASKSD